MKKIFFAFRSTKRVGWLFLCFLGIAPALYAQSYQIRGTVADSSGATLPNASVMLVQRADSVLVSFGLTDAKGLFDIKQIKTGKYALQITFVGYQTRRIPVEVSTASVEMGRIILQPAISRSEVTVAADRVPIVAKGDTLQYNAAAFRVRPNANVEELLKKLPGVEVDKDGNVKAMGKDVRRITVEGKDFFGNDPKVATRNLDADIVDKVEVFDRRSDIAEFTGVDDGERERTINLALKEDKKKGLFGKFEGGYGHEDRFAGRMNLNRFTKETQFSLLGNGNNINQQNFSMEDMSEMMVSGGGRGAMTFVLGGGDGSNSSMGGQSLGLATLGSGGLNFSHDFGNKAEINSSYTFNTSSKVQDRTATRQQILGTGNTYFTEETSKQDDDTHGHRANVRGKYIFGKGHDLQFRGNLSFNGATTQYAGNQATQNEQGAAINASQRSQNADTDGAKMRGELTYRRRLTPKGRSIIFGLQAQNNQNDQRGKLLSANSFFANGTTSRQNLNQQSTSASKQVGYTATMNYTEPLGRGKLLELRYTNTNQTSNQDRKVYDVLNGQNTLNNQLSNAYESDYLYHQVGTRFNYRKEGLGVVIGANVQNSNLNGTQSNAAQAIKKQFLNFLPQAAIEWQSGVGKNLNLRYDTFVSEPSLRDLQPVLDNRDPLNLYMGNPNLTAAYTHQLAANLFKFDMFTQKNFMAFINGRLTQNSIIQSRTINPSTLQQTATPINSDQPDLMLMGFSNFSRPLRPIKSKMSFDLNLMYNKGTTFINNALNESTRWSNGFGFRLENLRKETLDLAIGTRLAQNISQYSLNTELNRTYWTRTYYTDLSLYFGKDWMFNTEFRFNRYPATGLDTARDLPIWEARLSKQFPNQKGQFELFANDLLNQNLGLNRSETVNLIQDERVVSLGRYVMARFTYTFKNFGK